MRYRRYSDMVNNFRYCKVIIYSQIMLTIRCMMVKRTFPYFFLLFKLENFCLTAVAVAESGRFQAKMSVVAQLIIVVACVNDCT